MGCFSGREWGVHRYVNLWGVSPGRGRVRSFWHYTRKYRRRRKEDTLMKVALAADHAGFTMKGILAAQLEELGYEVEDFGAFDQIPSDYPDWARVIGRAVTT